MIITELIKETAGEKKEGMSKKASQAFNYNHMTPNSDSHKVFKETTVITNGLSQNSP